MSKKESKQAAEQTEPTVEKVDSVDMMVLENLRLKFEIAKRDAQAAELNLNSAQQAFVNKYKIQQGDAIDPSTGAIVRSK